MKKITYLVLFITFAINSIWAVTITSAQSGDWNSVTTWLTGNIPGIADTAIIEHDVTVTSAVTVGTSGVEGTAAITINSGAKLIIDNAMLTCRGDLVVNSTLTGALTLLAGGKLLFDDTAIGTAQSYELKLPASSGNPFFVRGDPGNRCEIGKVTGATNPTITKSSAIQRGVDAEYCDFNNLGSASTQGARFYAYGGAEKVRLINCNFDSCGTINTFGYFGTDYVEVRNCTFTNPLDTEDLYYQNTTVNTTGTRIFDNCVFMGKPTFITPKDVSIDNCYFHQPFYVTAPNTQWASFSNNFIRKTNSSGFSVAGDVSNSFVFNNHDDINPHGIYATFDTFDYVFDGMIFEHSGSNGEGDMILVGSPTQAQTVTVRNCIVLPNSVGGHSGTLITHMGSINHTSRIHNNTFITATDSGGIAVGETYLGHAGQIEYCRNNIAWDTTPRNYLIRDYGVNDNIPDLVSAANLDYNCIYNQLTGTNGPGYDQLEFSSGTPGQNDVLANPYFTDSTRDLAKWAEEVLGATGDEPTKHLAAMAALQAVNNPNDPDYNASATVANLLSYIRAGFTPNNQSLRGAAHDGGDIGAVAVNVCTMVDVGTDDTGLYKLLSVNTTNTFKVEIETTQIGTPATITLREHPSGTLIGTPSTFTSGGTTYITSIDFSETATGIQLTSTAGSAFAIDNFVLRKQD